jgi:serine/threonine protein kinase
MSATAPPNSAALPSSAESAIDAACERFEAAWKAAGADGPSPQIEEYLGDRPEPERAALLRELLLLDLFYRQRRGERPTAEDYAARNPRDEADIRAAFAAMSIAPAGGAAAVGVPAMRAVRAAGTMADPERTVPAEGTPPTGSSELAYPAIPGYEILGKLGQGGMGVVYQVRQIGLDRTAALKVIGTLRPPNASQRARFQTEMQAAARLDHPNIVRLFDSGEHEGRPYFLMEFVLGSSLKQALQSGPWTPRPAAQLVARLADAVAYAHRHQVIHRDLKPANILLAADGTPKIADFGLAKLPQTGEMGQTQPGDRVGSPPYMAPEQAAGRLEAIGPATDIFGLGAILYELLTGHPPFEGSTRAEVLDQARQGAVRPLRQLNPWVPPALERICRKALAADPEQRHPSAAALADDLRRYLGRLRRLALAATAVAGVLLAGLVAWLLTRGSGPSPPPPLSGELIVRLWTPDGRGKRGLRVDEPGALPAHPRDWVQVEARLNQPAYAYLLWLDGQGKVSPLYPWNDTKIVHGLDTPPPERPPQAGVYSPTTGPGAGKKGWPLDDRDGLETVLLLARRTPLPSEVKLSQLVGQLPPTRLRDPLEVAVRGFDPGQPVNFINQGEHRGFQEEAEEIDDPLLQLMGRLQEHFEMVRAVRFAHQGN